MPNILLTTSCNLDCPFCFAKEKLSLGKNCLSLNDARYIIDFLKKSHYSYFRVMGGEPTIHPEFAKIVAEALENGLKTDILSNATWDSDLNEFFSVLSPLKVRFLLNIGPEKNYSIKNYERILENLECVTSRFEVTLSFNITEKNPDANYILELVKRFSVKVVRLSYSLPIYNTENIYLPRELYIGTGDFILRFKKQLEEISCHLVLDNAVLPCIFTWEQIGVLIASRTIDLTRNLYCKPIIDIGPDLSVWSCFCLSGFKNMHLYDFETLQDIISYYSTVLHEYRETNLPYEKCKNCDFYKKWNCQGGCLSFGLRQQTKSRSDTTYKKFEPESVCLQLEDGIEIRNYSIPYNGYYLFDINRKRAFEIHEDIAKMINSRNFIVSSSSKKDPDNVYIREKEQLLYKALHYLKMEKLITY